MKTITTNNRTLLFVKVHEKAKGCELDGKVLIINHFPDGYDENITLPDGNYRLIATTDTITEQQAEMFVEKKHDNPLYFRNYYVENGACMYATVSFASLLQHHSITGRHAIIEVL